MFLDNELKASNDLNSRNLGGQQPRTSIGDDEDNDTSYEVNMEKIMARFSNFNTMSSASSNDGNDDDQPEDDDDIVKQGEEGAEDGRDEDDEGPSQNKSPAKEPTAPIEPLIVESEPLKEEFLDN